MRGRRFLAPEVIQTSAMDCGPAAIKSLLEGFGIRVSYGRLREACQTSVDGTSLDVLEDVAAALGLDVLQTMVPIDHLMAATATFPFVVVVRNPDGNVHFVVVWRKVGGLVQIMDPASGRHWLTLQELLERVYEHSLPTSLSSWREWAGSDDFLEPLRARLRCVGAHADSLIESACADPSWSSIAALDAATRFTQALVRAGGLDAGRDAARLVASAMEQVLEDPSRRSEDTLIPREFWSAAPATPGADGEPRVLLRGAVLLRVNGKRRDGHDGADDETPLAPELAAALRDEDRHPMQEIARMLRADGLSSPALVGLAATAAAAVGALEGLVLRGWLWAAPHLTTRSHRALAMVAVGVFFSVALGLEVPIAAHALRIGRRLELRLRAAFFAKLPRLSERYFASRPASDMSHRAHTMHAIRGLPFLWVRLTRGVAQLFVYALGLVWIDPPSWPFVLAALVSSIGVPLSVQRRVSERDRRLQAFEGALSHFYLDALLGLIPIRTHGAGPTIRRQHESMLSELRRAFMEMLAAGISVDVLVAFVNALVAFALLGQYMLRGGTPSGSLLFVYWALALPAVGEKLAHALLQYPQIRNTTERVLEPLGALEDDPGDEAPAGGSKTGPAEIRMEGVDVRAAGKPILEDVHLHLPAGSHLAIVGLSGAGKSSLCGLLLGTHRPARGQVLVDGEPLRGARLEALRRNTGWVDPMVQLWNRTLLANVTYGGASNAPAPAAGLEAADVLGLLQQLPHGLQSVLGDGGALLSGGEGQRVRLARAMRDAERRLVVLDEPFRGLERSKRQMLLQRARALWKGSTLLCVTHDIDATLDFERVVVLHERRIVEDGAPQELAARAGSHYAALLAAEGRARDDLWRDDDWRRVELRGGRAVEASSAERP
jgi:ABC-type bacteriocin/lantibiotic exporter with double-glycine peptidase domain